MSKIISTESENVFMNDMLKKIYQNVLVYERDTVEINKQVDEELQRLIKPYAEQLTKEELEKLKELLSAMALVGQLAGFEIGVQFGIKLAFKSEND